MIIILNNDKSQEKQKMGAIFKCFLTDKYSDSSKQAFRVEHSFPGRA